MAAVNLAFLPAGVGGMLLHLLGAAGAAKMGNGIRGGAIAFKAADRFGADSILTRGSQILVNEATIPKLFRAAGKEHIRAEN